MEESGHFTCRLSFFLAQNRIKLVGIHSGGTRDEKKRTASLDYTIVK
jgi:hypothetical protein